MLYTLEPPDVSVALYNICFYLVPPKYYICIRKESLDNKKILIFYLTKIKNQSFTTLVFHTTTFFFTKYDRRSAGLLSSLLATFG